MTLNTVWQQQYNPMNNIWLSALIAVIPIVIFLISLVFFKLKGYTAGALSIISSANSTCQVKRSLISSDLNKMSSTEQHA